MRVRLGGPADVDIVAAFNRAMAKASRRENASIMNRAALSNYLRYPALHCPSSPARTGHCGQHHHYGTPPLAVGRCGASCHGAARAHAPFEPLARRSQWPLCTLHLACRTQETEGLELPPDVAQRGAAAVLEGRPEAGGALYFLLESEEEPHQGQAGSSTSSGAVNAASGSSSGMKVVGQLMITTEWSDW